jgi:hypothetical protein
MKEYSLDKSEETTTPAGPPHFDDELTVLTARPVVPLEEIDGKRRRRYWFLAGAFVLAMILGAGSALLASYLKFRNAPQPASATSVVETEAAPVAAAEPVESDLPVVDNAEEESLDPEPPKIEPAVKRRVIVTRRPDPEPDDRPKMSEADELRSIRDAELFDQWEERRARRVLRRERRRAERSDRDLSNLDEIFEGRRRRP